MSYYIIAHGFSHANSLTLFQFEYIFTEERRPELPKLFPDEVPSDLDNATNTVPLDLMWFKLSFKKKW